MIPKCALGELVLFHHAEMHKLGKTKKKNELKWAKVKIKQAIHVRVRKLVPFEDPICSMDTE